MIKELKMDYERNEKKFPQIFILIVYRFSNYIYYSNLNKFIKRLILLPFKIINKLFIEFIFHIEIPCDATIGGGG